MTRSAPVTVGNDEPFVFVSGAVGVVEAGDVGGNSDPTGAVSYEEASDGVKLIVSDPVPRGWTFAVSITVEVSPRLLSVMLFAEESGLMV